MENIINAINNNITHSFGAVKVAEALSSVSAAEKAKTRKAANRMSRATRAEQLASLGIKVVTPITAAASAKFIKAEETRKNFEAAVKATKAAARAEQAVLDAAWDKVDEATANPNKGFNTFAAAFAKAKASR